MRKLIAPLLVLTLASCAWRRDTGFARQRLTGAPAAGNCFRDGAAAVCRWTPKGIAEDPDAVLFFLHYATGDERSAARVGVLQSFYRRYRDAGRRPPRVFTVSYGPHWLVSSQLGQRQVVDRADFEALLRRLEKTPPKRRYLWGMSMGGYNSAEEALASPEDWTAAALDCPALQTLNPFDAPTKGLSAKRRDGFVLFKIRLGSARVWDDENPLALAARRGPGPAFLIETNADDEFGFQPGARALAAALKASDHAATFRELPGTHCAVDGSAAADFFLSLPR
jgi:pimeloyl-ACP methyl ester carboxylesterase